MRLDEAQELLEAEGAIVESIELAGDLLRVELGHRGTDDGRVRLTFPIGAVILERWPDYLGR